MESITFAILTVSDTCSTSANLDRSGPALYSAILSSFPSSSVLSQAIVPDNTYDIEEKLRQWSDKEPHHQVILTTGGTGFSPRDVTPQATKAVVDYEAPGVVNAILVKSLAITDMAMLSRAICGVRNKTLIVNLPGSQKGSTECFGFIKTVIPHAVSLICNNTTQVAKAHTEIQGSVIRSKVKPLNSATRDRSSPFPMVSVPYAVNYIRKITTEMLDDLTPITMKLPDVLGYHLAEDIFSVDPVPSFRASIMDGYALFVPLRNQLLGGVNNQNLPKVISVKGTIAAGDKTERFLEMNTATRINTGAPVPENANCVIPIEITKLVANINNNLETIEITTDYPQQNFIRNIGTDIPANTLIATNDEEISPGHIGTFASVGCITMKVHQKQLSVGILSTGNELQPPTVARLNPGQIRDSNKLTLVNLLKKHRIESIDLGIVGDRPDDLKAAFMKGFKQCDVVLSTGGVSMGEHDFIKRVLVEDFNATIHFGRVNMKPGKPTTFASLQFDNKRKIVFGLPGNPASATVTAILFVIPFVRYLPKSKRSIDTYPFQKVIAELSDPISLDERPEFKRVTLIQKGNQWLANLTGDQISSRIRSFINANGLLILPAKTADCTELQAGSSIEAILI